LRASAGAHRILLLLGAVTAAALAEGCAEKEVIEGFPDHFVGIGVELTIKKDVPVVVRAIAGGPAEIAGLQAGDRILHVNGRTTGGRGLGNVVMMLRGAPGTQAVLGVKRGAVDITVVVKRAHMQKAESDYQKSR